MAHEIDMTNGRANMAYVGDVPWHGLGFELERGASIDEWRRSAGLAWMINRSPVSYRPVITIAGASDYVTVPGRDVLFRSDNNAPLGIVSDDYKIVQPAEVLEFYRDLVATSDFELETAGSLFGGKRIWALARTGDSFRLRGQDELRGYLLLCTSCDGSLATTAKFTSVRVVCNNTLEFSMMKSNGDITAPTVRVPHSRVFDAEQVKAQLGIAHEAWAGFEDVVSTLASIRPNKRQVQQWLVDTFGDNTKDIDDPEQPNQRIMKLVWDAVRTSPGANYQSANGTAWGLVNGVSYYIDHQRKTRTADARLNRSWFGDGAVMKRSAVEAALRIAA